MMIMIPYVFHPLVDNGFHFHYLHKPQKIVRRVSVSENHSYSIQILVRKISNWLEWNLIVVSIKYSAVAVLIQMVKVFGHEAYSNGDCTTMSNG